MQPDALLASASMPRAKKPAEETAGLPFEQAIERLEGVVDQLEDGELDLEASLVAFEEGVALFKRCAGQLESAERRIEILVKEGGETLARPFEDAGDAGDNGDNGDNGDDRDNGEPG